MREVPLPGSVLDASNAHITARPPIDVRLPWEVPSGKPTGFVLLLSTRERTALNRNYFNSHPWRPALKRAGVPIGRENGTHALRHFNASTALHEGESIKALSEYLGHADPGLTLRTYNHLDEGRSQKPGGLSMPSWRAWQRGSGHAASRGYEGRRRRDG
jgi:integrase